MSGSRTSFVRLFVGFLLSATGACCPIELTPPSVVLHYGDTVSVNCTTSEDMHDGIGWEASVAGTGLEMVNHLTWSVKNLTQWSVSALCFINPAHTSLWKQSFPETISLGYDDDTMREGNQYNFTCDIRNVAPVQNVTVRWYKGDTIIQTHTFDDPSKEPVDLSPVLSYTPTREDEGVKFRCEAHLDLGPDGPQLNVSSEEFNATVLFGPDVQCSTVELLEGQTLENRCPVTGNPVPVVTWLKGNEYADVKLPLSRKEAGMYTIRSEGLSESIKDIQVHVMYGPELNCTSKYIAIEYAPRNLTCTFEGYPEPKVTWYKDFNEVELPENLTRRDAGHYLITASNKLSNASHRLDIVIIYPPSQILELEDSVVDVGYDLRLKCSSSGNPQPTYSWSYYRTANVMEENEDGVSSLIIRSATSYNIGLYTCQASNDRGYISKTVRVTVKGAEPECPITVTPDRMVIPYQGNAMSVACVTNSTNVKDLYWQGVKTNSTIWRVDTHNDWDLSPVCTATFEGIGTCQKPLTFILYKTPDSVSIQSVDDFSSLEGEKRQLQCDIINVAPVRNLAVLWYHGNETIKPVNVFFCLSGSLQVTGCPPENTNCDIRTPVNVSSTISITLNRSHNKAAFRCGAQLNLEPERLQPLYMSSPLNITVYYKPVINDTKLQKAVPVFRGYPEILVCEADGHPPPKIQWLYSSDKKPNVSGGTLIVSEPGLYSCNATNDVGSVSHDVKVILKEDYLPLIAGFVAVTVVVISVIFVFIYSIYYKNTKMRRYSLKNPKLSTHNGNVAHNGWDMQFPMTKLS
ncbi:hypothetical protein PAMA_009640 [Pampus argenteus]